jgi:phage protein U
MSVLFQIGLLQVQIAPFSVDTSDFETGSDWAAKDLVGAPKSREFMGEADTKLKFCGKLFPHRFGGLDELDTAEAMAKSGDPQMVIRGDGKVFGWYLVEKISEKSSVFNSAGVGRQIEVEIELTKSPTGASAQSMMSTLQALFG